MRAADRNERLTTSNRPRADQGVERGDGELRLRERQASLGAGPGVPARRRRVEPRRLLFERQQLPKPSNPWGWRSRARSCLRCCDSPNDNPGR